jgi:hypothetical protein
VVYGSFNYNVSHIRRKKRGCLLLTARGNVRIAEWSARAPTAHTAVHSYRKLEKRSSRRAHCLYNYGT